MDVTKLDFTFDKDAKADSEPPVRIAFLGTRHPHVLYRFTILDKMAGFEFVGMYEENQEIAEGFATRIPKLQRFHDPGALLREAPDVVMIHALDPDTPRWARFVLDHAPSSLKALFLEKPGAADPKDFVALAEEIQARRPKLAVELGYELHYAESLAFARKVVREGVLGDITTARFHGGCPSGAGMDLWQSIPEDLGGIMQTEGCHTLENVLDLFGPPQSILSSIRKLPKKPPHPIVGWIPHVFAGTVADTEFSIGSLLYEDIASAILEYPDKNVIMDLTAWEPTEWCHEWAIDVYGTNGSLHVNPDPATGQLFLREARASFLAGRTEMKSTLPVGQSGIVDCYRRQFETLFRRAGGLPAEDGDCGLGTATDIMRVIGSAYVSGREGRKVDIV